MQTKYFAGYRLAEVRDEPGNVNFPMAVLYPTSVPEKMEQVETVGVSVSVNAPFEEGEFPLALISHGSGGSPLFYRTLALHLARGGFIVGLPEHPFDNRRDSSLAGTVENLANRPRHIRKAIDWFFGEFGEFGGRNFSRALRRDAVAVVGHSIGGYTALAAAGGIPVPPPDGAEPFFRGEPQEEKRSRIEVEPDPRIRALVLLAPATVCFGVPGALRGVDIPILMVVGDKDTFTPYNHHARLVLDGVPDKGKVRCGIVRNAGHFSFMNPFPDQRLGAQAARDPSGFDPEKFLEELNSEVLSFLSLTFAE